jgi:DNA modification methylase
VLDPFGGSGTTLIAAEKTGRIARLIEFDPAYCDTILRRFERVTRKQANLAVSGDALRTPSARVAPSRLPRRSGDERRQA